MVNVVEPALIPDDGLLQPPALAIMSWKVGASQLIPTLPPLVLKTRFFVAVPSVDNAEMSPLFGSTRRIRFVVFWVSVWVSAIQSWRLFVRLTPGGSATPSVGGVVAWENSCPVSVP